MVAERADAEWAGDIDPRFFRDVLGHYPTGVAVVTAIDEQGEPVGMAVGSFTSVSLSPPLIAFLPDRSSTTFPAIRAVARFCVNVLSGQQESVCRAFAMRGADRFGGVQWRPAPYSGAPILADSVTWVDCEIEQIHEAGDHFIVIGRVHDLAVQNPTLPLVFFQGGYGSFGAPSLVVADRDRLSEQVRLGDAARATLERVAEETGIEVRAMAVDGADLVIVASAGSTEGAGPVGSLVPLSPPFGNTLIAWGNERSFDEWVSRAADDGDVDAAGLAADIERVRRDGWSMTFDSPKIREAGELVDSIAALGRTPNLERRLMAIGAKFGRLADPETLTDANAHLVRTVSAPVFADDDRPVLHVTLYDFPAGSTRASVLAAKDALVRATADLSAQLGARRAH